MPKVSVIIPVYNTERYLRRCLDSVCNQTLSDIEIICVNDCSPDNSLDILNEYATKDSRIKIIDFKENKGAAVARNTGINETQGEYIAFLDSDDYPNIDFYENLYNVAINNGADIAKGAYRYPNNFIPDIEFNKKIIEDKNNFSYGYCSAIFKKELIKKNNIQFPKLIDMEDPVFAYNAAIKANKILVIKDNFINITVRENSQTAGTPTFERIKSKFAGLQHLIKIANTSPIQKESYIYTMVLWFDIIVNNSFLNTDINIRNYVAETIMSVFNKIIYKNEFIAQLGKKNKFLAQAIVDNKKDQLINYERAMIIYNIREKIKHGK